MMEFLTNLTLFGEDNSDSTSVKALTKEEYAQLVHHCNNVTGKTVIFGEPTHGAMLALYCDKSPGWNLSTWWQVWRVERDNIIERRNKMRTFKQTLINGQPIATLPRDGRKVIITNQNGYEGVKRFYEGDATFDYCEWADFVKPEPKPDSNGWWKTSEKSPPVGITVEAYESEFISVFKVTFEWDTKTALQGQRWREWRGPVA